MDTEDRDEAARNLLRELGRATGFSAIPPHVVYRLVSVLGTTEPLYVDSNVDINRANNGAQSLSGDIIGFTDSVAFRVTLKDVQQRPDSDTAATVSVTAWSRRTLTGVAIKNEHNTDDTWASAQYDLWPREARATLTYKGQPEPLVLPLSPSGAAGFGAILPAVTADL
jgi:hypothetical protein